MKGYELRVLIWITIGIYFFHQKFYQIQFMFYQCNKFLLSKLPSFTVKLTGYTLREKIFVISSDNKTT